jgi:deoxyadenosine/deoxycytidine kinase
VFFLTIAYACNQALLASSGSVMQDRSIYEDAEIFAYNLFLQGSMRPARFRFLPRTVHRIHPVPDAPDLMIYLLRIGADSWLNATNNVIVITNASMNPAYLEQLNALYEKWISNFTLCSSPHGCLRMIWITSLTPVTWI